MFLLEMNDDSVMARGRDQVPSVKTGLARALLGPMTAYREMGLDFGHWDVR